ncbi:putative leader peptide [Streptomyces triculaminicus]|uniref:putative leader peptide n=1 Tax=Streptomyces triculaminicus TaxID=2816232 RepID=UPI0035584653
MARRAARRGRLSHGSAEVTEEPSRIARRLFSSYGRQWTGRRPSCHASVMSRAGVALVSRRHVDLGRMSSAICPAG